MPRKTLPLPSFYNSDHAADFSFDPDQAALFAAANDWSDAHNIKPSASDRFRIHLLLIDLQKDFCFPQGSLFVGGLSGDGAIEDNKRIAEFTYRNLDVLTEIATTLDTHFAFQIFFASFWVDASGKPLASHTMVEIREKTLLNTLPDGTVLSSGVRPNPAVAKWLCNGNYAWLIQQVKHYCRELKRVGKYTLYLWPAHCILGSAGHGLAGVIHEARMFHSYVRGSQSDCEIKGGHPLTENYSVLRPEVLTYFDGRPMAQKNSRFLEKLFHADALVIGGQAASHCVLSTIDDILDEILSQDPALARKVYIMTDCMSSVVVKDPSGNVLADFTPQAEAALKRFEAAGMHLVKSTDPIDTWDGIKLG